jgi:taurine--2-oxoglutarate transaminase
MFERLRQMQSRHAVVGDVRGGDGLFAVIELVCDRATREPLSPWPQMHPGVRTLLSEAMKAGVSFAARGNLILLAPPLIIDEQDLGAALDLLDSLLAVLPRSSHAITPHQDGTARTESARPAGA